MSYIDFTLALETAGTDEYRVRVLESPAGQAKGVFSYPVDFPSIDELWVDCGRSVRSSGSFRDVSPLPRSRQVGQESERLGEILFRMLLPGAVQTRFAESRGQVQAQQNHGLRIKLHLDPSEPELARLCALPWEFLYLSETRDFFGRSRSCSLVRYLDVPRPPQPLLVQPPLRIAVLLSSPRDLPPLALCQERESIRRAFQEVADTRVVFLEWTGPAAFREQLLDGKFHVFHFMGHGRFNHRTGDGALMVEGAGGLCEPLSGRSLSELLKDCGPLRLAVLNACETATSTGAEDLDPFAGVAASLVQAGLPAVIAMQFQISDAAAVAFSRTFYSRLAKGDSLDEAVSEGRLAIYAANEHSLEWATPVLFMRVPDGRLFCKPASRAANAEFQLGLERLADSDLAAPQKQVPDRALGLFYRLHCWASQDWPLTRRRMPLFLGLWIVFLGGLVFFALERYAWRGKQIPQAYQVRALVLSQTGQPADEARVWSTRGGEAKKVAGGWELELPAAKRAADGKLTLFATQGEQRGETTVTLDGEAFVAATIQLNPPAAVEVRGIVQDESSRALGKVRITLEETGAKTETAADGTFQLPSRPSGEPVTLQAEKAGYRTSRVTFPAQGEPLHLQLEKVDS